jgi:hypothetical protein
MHPVEMQEAQLEEHEEHPPVEFTKEPWAQVRQTLKYW